MAKYSVSNNTEITQYNNHIGFILGYKSLASYDIMIIVSNAPVRNCRKIGASFDVYYKLLLIPHFLQLHFDSVNRPGLAPVIGDECGNYPLRIA